MLPAGIILTGGASQLAGVAELGREVLEMPVRVAAPAGIGGLVDTLLTPVYSTAVGLLQWGATTLAAGEPMRYESAPAMGGLGPHPRRPAEHLPVEDPRARRVRTGPGARAVRPDRGLCRRSLPTATDADGLLSVFVPHATAGARDRRDSGPGSDDDLVDALDRLLPRDERCTATATGRRATAPTTSCRCWRRRR